MQKGLFRELNPESEKTGELYKLGVGDAGLLTYNSALMALYFALQEGAGAGGGMKIKGSQKNTGA